MSGTTQLLRRAVFRYDVSEWHRGVDVRIYDPHWGGYEPISVRVLGDPPQPLEGAVDVEVWFRRIA